MFEVIEAAPGCLSKWYCDLHWDIYDESCSRYHVLNKTECIEANHDWHPEVLATGSMAYVTGGQDTGNDGSDTAFNLRKRKQDP